MKILYLDLDGVVVDIVSHAKSRHGENVNIGKATSFDKDLFLNPPMIEGALDAITKLSEHYNLFFLSTAPWSNTNSWSHKRIWLQENLGKLAWKRLILSHRKDLLMGDYLVDDRIHNGAGDFKGLHIHFRQEGFENWEKTLNFLMKNK